MKDKFNDLIPWLEKLLEDLAKVGPDDDREEARRRLSRLARFVSFFFFFLFLKSVCIPVSTKVRVVFDISRPHRLNPL